MSEFKVENESFVIRNLCSFYSLIQQSRTVSLHLLSEHNYKRDVLLILFFLSHSVTVNLYQNQPTVWCGQNDDPSF